MRRFHFAVSARRCGAFVGASIALLIGAASVPACAKPLRIVAFGDSLTAGYQLPADAAFPVVLEKSLRRDGFDVTVSNAGVSGDTTAAGLERIDWSVPDGTDGVILELGANDMLRGFDPAATRKTLDEIVQALQGRRIKVFLAGMRATPTLGPEYTQSFDAIYPDLAKRYALPLYPFFMDGVAGQAALQLHDGMHPNPAGVDVIVKGIMPGVEAWLKAMEAGG